MIGLSISTERQFDDRASDILRARRVACRVSLYFRLHRPDGSLAEAALLWAQRAVRWLMARRAG